MSNEDETAVQKIQTFIRKYIKKNKFNKHFDILLALMQKVTRNEQERDKKHNLLKLKWQFGIGRTVNRWQSKLNKEKNYLRPHNFKPTHLVNFQNIDERKGKTKIQKELYHAASNLLLDIDADYAKNEDYIINFSCMNQESYVKKHTDKEDLTYQYLISLGDFEGGELKAYNKNGKPFIFSNKRKIVKLDGRLQHEVLPVTSGSRYAIIFYKIFDRTMTKPCELFENPVFVS